MDSTEQPAAHAPEGTPAPAPARHLDVVIVGAGISGIGVAHYLQSELPRTTFTILEARARIGGTWDLFRYPGIRSDSDLYTFGYAFRPWRDDDSIASGEKILAYLRDTIRDEGLEGRIELNKRVVAASWSTSEARWTLRVESPAGAGESVTCRWVFGATGYFRYDAGYTPPFEGRARFRGRVVHPQQWPEELDVAGQRVVVIGSGATAVTLVPALAEKAAHVVQLQRTPTYLLTVPRSDRFAVAARALLGDARGHALSRWNHTVVQRLVWNACRQYPRAARRVIRWTNVRQLPEGYPVDEHFNPPYDPWDQRLCLVPDGDFFRAIRAGRASVVTDRIETFTETGIALTSGRALEADLIVTATGLSLLPFGGIRPDVDGVPIRAANHIVYRGMMLDGVPNFAFAIGYTNASWTLKVGLLCTYFVRLLRVMEEEGWDVVAPRRPEGDLETRPFLDFGAGYVRRAVAALPRQGPTAPWVTSKDYFDDVRLLQHAPVQDGHLEFRRAPVSGARRAERGAPRSGPGARAR